MGKPTRVRALYIISDEIKEEMRCRYVKDMLIKAKGHKEAGRMEAYNAIMEIIIENCTPYTKK